MNEEERFLKELQEQLDREMADINLTPREEIDNLSPTDLHNILYRTFEMSSPIGFRNEIDSSTLRKIPFLQLSLVYLRILEEHGPMKLTKLGNLPRKLCFQLYETGIIKEDYIEKGYIKLNKEGDLVAIQNIKNIGFLGGLTKKRKNEISLTSKGQKLLQSDSEKDLLELIFRVNCQKLNMGYHDGYPQNVGIQASFGYSLYLLLRYGSEKKKADFYSEKYMMAFPSILNHFGSRWSSAEEQFKSCYELRVFQKFLKYYNFVDYENERSPLSRREPIDVIATEVFREVFELRKEKFRFLKSGHQA